MSTFCIFFVAVIASGGTGVDVDVLVYGGTPAGIAASISAAETGESVLLVEPYRFVGGLVTNGLSHTDYRTYEGLSGPFLTFAERVHRYYREKYGESSQQVEDCRRGTNAEPHVNRRIFEAMLAEPETLEVVTQYRLHDVATEMGGKHAEPERIASATFDGPEGKQLVVRAKIYIDASYEGDLLASGGIPYAVGREASSKYGESLAPDVADGQVQGYNFRLIVTNDPDNRVWPQEPKGYRREDFLALIPLLGTDQLASVWCDSKGGIYKAHLPALPNGKYDVNDVSRGVVRLSMPDLSDAWPDGDADIRQEIYSAHVRHNMGMLYFLQNDAAVPKEYRDEAKEYGWCRDEFVESGHMPEQLYVREARRMLGMHVFTEQDTKPADDDVRSVLRTDSVAVGDYSHNCHGTNHEGPRVGGRHTGEFYKATAPYQVPYGVIVPKRCSNLLVPVACSSSHVGFCALRLEPIWMSLGEAAGVAAHLAAQKGCRVQDVPIDTLQSRLHVRGAATIYTGDVSSDSPEFAAVQWWGTHGGLHGLESPLAKPGQRGEHITSQYFAKFPGHDVDLNAPLDDDLRVRWERLAVKLGADLESVRPAMTRGEFVRKALRSASEAP